MERQLKERLIGAAVLIAIAVIMVPEMFSGIHGRAPPPGEVTAPASQLTTYRIELQPAAAPASVVAATSESSLTQPVELPAERPRDEESSSARSASTAASSSSAYSSSSQGSSKVAAVKGEVRSSLASAAKVNEAKTAVVTTVAADAGWIIQIGSFGTRDKAQQIADKLKAQGYSTAIGPVRVANKTLYRVRVGSSSERSAAEARLKPLKLAFPGASVVQAGH